MNDNQEKPTVTQHNIVSVSGGKDSTALLLLAIERQTENLQAVFADTGHEHAQTYEYVQYLNDNVFPIRTIRADFSAQIERKREYVTTKWPEKLVKPVQTQVGVEKVKQPIYKMHVDSDEDGEERIIQDIDAGPIGYQTVDVPIYEMLPANTPEQRDAIITRALAALKPTGNPFLDLCIWKGRFPSTKARFCSEELKRNPIIEQVQMPLLEAGDDVISWQGVRADESLARRDLPERDCVGGGPDGGSLWNYRPILKWTVDDVFAMHRKHGVKPNPLYAQGMGRVGCMPCIHARKDELLEISRRFPDEVARVAEWEKLVSEASKRGKSTFFATADGRGDGVLQIVEWSKTSRGGTQYDFLRADNDNTPLCSSIYGLCE